MDARLHRKGPPCARDGGWDLGPEYAGDDWMGVLLAVNQQQTVSNLASCVTYQREQSQT